MDLHLKRSSENRASISLHDGGLTKQRLFLGLTFVTCFRKERATVQPAYSYGNSLRTTASKMDHLLRIVCVLVFFAPFRGLVADKNCPVVVPQCKCEIFLEAPVINCEGLGTITSLPEFTAVETTYEWLKFNEGTTLRTLPNNAFRNLKVKSLWLERMSIENIEPLAFAGLEDNLENANFGYNTLTSLGGFKSLRKLRGLKVHNNKLTGITASDFAPFASTLGVLNLSHNKLSSATGAFSSLKALRTLTLTGCSLPALAPGDFAEGMPLRTLDMRFNNLTSVPGEAFSKLKNIKAITLTDNQITILPKYGFADMPKLEYLLLYNNKITRVEKEAFKNLPSMRILNLRNNLIEGAVTKDMFVGVDKFESFNITNNQITSMENLYTSFPKFLLLDVSQNPLRCDCAIAWMRTEWYSIQGLSTMCAAPPNHVGMNIKSFPADGCTLPTTTSKTTTTTSTTMRPISKGARITMPISLMSLAAIIVTTF